MKTLKITSLINFALGLAAASFITACSSLTVTEPQVIVVTATPTATSAAASVVVKIPPPTPSPGATEQIEPTALITVTGSVPAEATKTPTATTPPESLAPDQVKLKAEIPAANIRQDPSLQAKVVGTVTNSEVITIQGRTRDYAWLQIDYQGQPVWLAADLVEETASLNRLPVVSVAATPTAIPQAEPAAIIKTTQPQPLYCPDVPIRGFGQVWGENPEVKTTLGCPDSWQGGEQGTQAAVQLFQNGLMVWLQADGVYNGGDPVYVFFADGSFQRFADLGTADPAKVGTLPAGFYPVGDKFSKVYWEGTGAQVKERLGYALGPASETAGAFQQFSNGRMFWTEKLDRIFVVYEYGYFDSNDNWVQVRTWNSYEDKF